MLAGKPPPLVAKNVRRFLTAMRARRRWRTYFGFSIAPDTNISAVSDSEIIYIHDLPFRRNAFEGESSGVGLILWGGGEYQHPLGKRLRLRLGADMSRREYEGNEFDQMFVSLHAGPRWRAAANTELSLLGSARRRWTGGEIQDSVVRQRCAQRHRARRPSRGQSPLHPKTDGPGAGLLARADVRGKGAPGRAEPGRSR